MIGIEQLIAATEAALAIVQERTDEGDVAWSEALAVFGISPDGVGALTHVGVSMRDHDGMDELDGLMAGVVIGLQVRRSDDG